MRNRSSVIVQRHVARLAAVALVPSLVVIGTAIGPAAPASAATAVTCPASPVGGAAPIDVPDAGFQPIAPVRIADTRAAAGTPQVGDDCVLQVDLAAASPPADAVAVALTVTSDRASDLGYVSAYGCGSPRTNTSVLNPDPALPSPNLVILPLDTTGRACFYSLHATDLIVDVTGWFVAEGARLREMDPARVLDTRNGTATNGLPPGKLTAGSTIRVPIADYFIPGDAVGVAATITVTNAEQGGWITAWPCGSPQPATSVNNVLAGRDRAVSALLGIGEASLCIYTDITTDVIVDVTGCFCPDEGAATAPPNAPLATILSERVADSRQGPAPARVPPGAEQRYDLSGIVPPGTTAAALNITATDAVGAGYLTAYLCDVGPGPTSSVNFTTGTTETTLTTIGLGPGADVCIYTSAEVHVIVDLYATYGFPGTLRQFVTTPPLERAPAPGQRDHTIRCAAAGSQVTVELMATSGARVSVEGQPPATATTWTGTLHEDDLIAITATGPGSHVEEHHVRCLPHDFPQIQAAGASPTPGWYVAASMSPSNFAFILDEYGVPIWYRRTPYPVVGIFPQAGGDLAWRQWTGGPGGFPAETSTEGIEIRDLQGAIVDQITIPGGSYVIGWHEFLTLPNGNRVVTSYTERPLTGDPDEPSTCRNGADMSQSVTPDVLIDSEVIELDAATDAIVGTPWSTATHLAFDETVLAVCFDLDPGAGTEWGLDLAHVNAVDVFPNGDWLISMRHASAVYRVRPSTGAVVWKLGGTLRGDGTSLTVQGDPRGGPGGPHDGRVLSDGSVTMHDNHVTPTGASPSRAVQYTIDTAAKTATLAWSYTSPINRSGTLGSVRRQPDGNTVIGWGASWQPWLEEVDAAGERVLSARIGDLATFYRVVKLPESTYDRDELRAMAGGTMAPAAW